MRAGTRRGGGRGSGVLTAIVLAAGGSSRLGAPKQLLRYRARPLLIEAVAAAREATSAPPVVVLGAHALRLRALLRRSGGECRIAYNAGWRRGLASSVHAGLDALPRSVRAALFVLVDQPRVDSRALHRLVAAWSRRPAAPAAAHYAGRAGVPAVLPRRTWRLLRDASGDIGARRVLAAQGRRTLVEMPQAALDVDVPADVRRLRPNGAYAPPEEK